MKAPQRSPKSATAVKKRYDGFSDEEKSAMRDRVQEQKTGAKKADGESELLAKIAEMTPSDRAMAERIHAIIKSGVPSLSSTTWYGMPAYTKDGKIVCHFQPAKKFKTRYATFGFSDRARLDDGDMWPNAYALTKLSRTDEARLVALVKKAVS